MLFAAPSLVGAYIVNIYKILMQLLTLLMLINVYLTCCSTSVCACALVVRLYQRVTWLIKR